MHGRSVRFVTEILAPLLSADYAHRASTQKVVWLANRHWYHCLPRRHRLSHGRRSDRHCRVGSRRVVDLGPSDGVRLSTFLIAGVIGKGRAADPGGCVALNCVQVVISVSDI